MNVLPNYKFSRKKDRPLSSFESGVDSIRRRLSVRPRRISREREGANTISPTSYRMPNGRNGRAEVNGESTKNSASSSRKSGTSGNGYTNGSGIENGEENRMKNDDSNTRGGGNRHNKESADHLTSLNLGAYTSDVLDLSKGLQKLSDRFTKHADQISEVPNIHAKWDDLMMKCTKQDDKIKQQRTTITELRDMGRDLESEFADRNETIQRERETLEGEKEKFERYKRSEEQKMKARGAEDKIALSTELKRLQAKSDKEHKDRMQKLEGEWKNRDVENAKKLSDLEAEREKLADELSQQMEVANEQQEELRKTTDQCENLEIVKITLKKQIGEFESQVKAMKDEFAADSLSEDFYKNSFNDISRDIENISAHYFTNVSRDDFDANRRVHQRLSAADQIFNSIPISDTEESQNLLLANAQRIISASLCQVIWQPFSTEKTLNQPQFISILTDIYAELARTGRGSSSGRAPGVWNTLTMRALQSLSTAAKSPLASTSQRSHLPSPLDRAGKVVHDVFSILSLLLPPLQESQFRKDIYNLAQAAISVWNSAQLDELEIDVSLTLDPIKRSEWRSLKFDSPPSSYGNTDQGIISSTYPRTFTLFPRVTARKPVAQPSPAAGPPGSWPESGSETLKTEVCIHTGTGLLECSALVLRGKAEEEEAKSVISNAMDTAKKEFTARRKPGHSRRGSMMSSTTEPPSPIAQWKGMSDGTKAVAEE